MLYEVWAEGYRTNGESSEAIKLGCYEAEDFDSAVLACICSDEFKSESKFFVYSICGYHSYWGCRLFDNEKDARVSFG